MMKRLIGATCGLALLFCPGAAAARDLERDVLDAVRSAGFDQVLDGSRGPSSSAPWYPRIASTPQVDVAVIELNAANRAVDAANVLMSRDHPDGVVVPLKRDLDAGAVRYRKWDLARWDGTGGKSWTDPWPASEDVVAGREDAPLQFMSPYPASVLKVMVAYGILRLVDRDALGLDDPVTYTVASGQQCYAPGADTTETVREWMTLMITESSNVATCALIRTLHQEQALEELNRHFAEIGVPSLTLKGTNPEGGSWSGGRGVFMGALDTTKLLWLVDGGPGVLWRAPSGRKVTAAELSADSRRFFKYILSEQGFNEVLATTNWCGATLGENFPDADRPYPVSGIPTATPELFILPDGTVEVEGVPYGQEVGPCNAQAEVVFSHKTGLVYNAGADAGFVHELPGERRRDYVIAVFTNLGNRFTDPVMNTAFTDPAGPFGCWTERDVCYTEALARLGKSIDAVMQRHGRR